LLGDTRHGRQDVADASRERLDDHGRAFAGSQLQIQIYASRREADLTASVITALRGVGAYAEGIRWVSPLERQRFAEACDGSFLDALELSRLRPELSAFWPAGGPRWDGLAILAPGPGSLLVEAKSYPEEMYGSGCQATPNSRKVIEESLAKAKAWAGVDEQADWLGPLYQYANRLAHVFFLREVGHLDAWLVHLCFVGDPHRPTSLQRWQQQLSVIKDELGFKGKKVPFAVNVFLPARSREELLGVV
jgi:hypothetical protein